MIKKTIQQLPPPARKLTRLQNELSSIRTKIKYIIPEVARAELDSQALFNSKEINGYSASSEERVNGQTK